MMEGRDEDAIIETTDEDAMLEGRDDSDKDAMMKATDEEPTYGTAETADDIKAVLEGKRLATVQVSKEAKMTSSFRVFNDLTLGIRSFVSQMNAILSKNYNLYRCFPKMEVEMQESDENEDVLMVNEVVNKLADVQGFQNRNVARLFRRIRQFVLTTRNRGSSLVRDIRSTISRVLSRIYQCFSVFA